MANKSGDFDWKTDSDEGWELATRRQSRVNTIRERKRRFIILGLLMIIFAITVIGVVVFIDQRADRNQDRTVTEVLNGHFLLIQAIEGNDYELYSELLTKRKIGWRSLQEELLRRQLVLGRTSLGLLKQPSTNLARANLDQSVKLGADLQTAEVVDQVTYSIALRDHLTQTISLERVFHYRREGSTWKYTSPLDEDAFWGKWSQIEMENITIGVPQRDEDLGQIYSKKLDSLVGDLCSETEIECPMDFHLRLQLDRQPRSLLRLGDGFKGDRLRTGTGQYSLVLPAPTLVGRPIDDSGNEVLYKVYAGWVAAVMMTNYYKEFGHSDPQLLSDYLTKWDLQPPLAPDLIMPRAAKTTLSDPDSLPEQDILMLCAANQQLNLWRYNPINNHWSDELAGVEQDIFGSPPANSQAMLHRSPDVQGVLLTMRQMDGEGSRWRTYLWQDDVSHLLLNEETLYFYWPSLFFSWIDQSHGRITVFRPANDDPRSDSLAAGWYDIQECLISMCELQIVEGIPFWSPDGQSSIIYQGFASNSPFLSLADERGWLLHDLGVGFPIGWLDGNHFAYLLKSNDDRESVTFDGFDELVMTTISGQNGEIGSTETVIKSSDLADGLVDESLMDQLKIDSALPVDSEKNGWVIVVSNTNNREAPISYVFRHYPDEDETNIITTIDGKGEFPVILGQRAGFLAITWRYEELLNFEIYDVVDGQLLWHDYTFPYDWSDDGEWLIFVEQGSLRLIAPKSRHEIVIPYDLRGCYSAVWADRHP